EIAETPRVIGGAEREVVQHRLERQVIAVDPAERGNPHPGHGEPPRADPAALAPAGASRVLSQKFVVAPRTALRPPGKARRRSRIKEIRRGGVTQPGGMQRRPNANEFLGQDTSSRSSCRSPST